MAASKKAHCAHCQKKCSGNVLRYQDQYYHKQCFERAQSESLTANKGFKQQQEETQSSLAAEGGDGRDQVDSASDLQQFAADETHPQLQTATPPKPSTSFKQKLLHGNRQQKPAAQQTTKTFTTHSQTNLWPGFDGPRQSFESRASNLNSNPSNLASKRQDPASSRANSGKRQGALQATGSTSNIATINEIQQQWQPFAMTAERNGRASASAQPKANTIDSRPQQTKPTVSRPIPKSATLPPLSNGFLTANGAGDGSASGVATATCAACHERISDGQALIALDLYWHVWCFKCAHCKTALHGEYVAKDNRAYCERDYQKLFGICCVYCKRYITGKVLQAGEAHHFHPSCARCSKCGDPFVPGEEMYLQGEVTWHPRCGPGPTGGASTGGLVAGTESSIGLDQGSADRSQLRTAHGVQSPSLSSRSRSASPFSYMSRQYGRASSPTYADSEAVGDLSRVYTISYLNADPNQGYLRRPVEPRAPKSPQFSRPTSLSRLGAGGSHIGAASDRSRCSSRSQQYIAGAGRERSVPRGMYSVLSSMRSGGSSIRARSPSMLNEEAIQLAAYPSGQRPSPDSVPKIERDDFPAPPFPYPADRHTSAGQRGQQARHRRRGQSAGAASLKRGQQNSRGNLDNGAGKNEEDENCEDGSELEAAADEAQTAAKSNGLQAGQGSARSAQERASRPRSREINAAEPATRRTGSSAGQNDEDDDEDRSSADLDPQFRKDEEELSKIANGIGKIFLQTLKERERLRAWKRANLDPRNASRTPSATRELPSRLRYENPTNASPSRDLDRPRPWDEEEQLYSQGEHSPTRTRSSLGRGAAGSTGPGANAASASYGYKVVQSNRSTPRPGYGLTSGPYGSSGAANSGQQLAASPSIYVGGADVGASANELSFAERQRVAQAHSNELLGRGQSNLCQNKHSQQHYHYQNNLQQPQIQSDLGDESLARAAQATPASGAQAQKQVQNYHTSGGSVRSLTSAAHLRRSMPNVANLHHLHQLSGPPKLYPYHLLATSNYRLPPDVDRCHLERHLSNEEFQYIFHCDRLDFYRLPEWKRNELKRRARLF